MKCYESLTVQLSTEEAQQIEMFADDGNHNDGVLKKIEADDDLYLIDINAKKFELFSKSMQQRRQTDSVQLFGAFEIAKDKINGKIQEYQEAIQNKNGAYLFFSDRERGNVTKIPTDGYQMASEDYSSSIQKTVHQSLDKLKPLIKNGYYKGDKLPNDRVVMNFTIGTDGHPKDVTINKETPVRNDDFRDCLLKLFQRMKFDKTPCGEERKINYPIKFHFS